MNINHIRTLIVLIVKVPLIMVHWNSLTIFSIFNAKMDVFPILILQYVVSFIQCQFRSEKG